MHQGWLQRCQYDLIKIIKPIVLYKWICILYVLIIGNDVSMNVSKGEKSKAVAIRDEDELSLKGGI